MTYKTYSEWEADGYLVKKGEHHLKRNDRDEYLFSSEQVINIEDCIATHQPNYSMLYEQVQREHNPYDTGGEFELTFGINCADDIGNYGFY